MKTLYHGTNSDFDKISLQEGSEYKDFGQGFYLTDDIETARRMAVKKARLFGGIPTLITYQFDDSDLSALSVKNFPARACAEWFEFIDKNRDRKFPHPVHDFDIVIGPIANDGVVLQFGNYHNGLLSSEQAAVLLQDRFLDQQYYFGSEAAIVRLKKISSETL